MSLRNLRDLVHLATIAAHLPGLFQAVGASSAALAAGALIGPAQEAARLLEYGLCGATARFGAVGCRGSSPGGLGAFDARRSCGLLALR